MNAQSLRRWENFDLLDESQTFRVSYDKSASSVGVEFEEKERESQETNVLQSCCDVITLKTRTWCRFRLVFNFSCLLNCFVSAFLGFPRVMTSICFTWIEEDSNLFSQIEVDNVCKHSDSSELYKFSSSTPRRSREDSVKVEINLIFRCSSFTFWCFLKFPWLNCKQKFEFLLR